MNRTTREIQAATIEEINQSIGKLDRIIFSDCPRADRAQARGYRAQLIKQLGVKREENARN
jgi:hypothetical protein